VALPILAADAATDASPRCTNENSHTNGDLSSGGGTDHRRRCGDRLFLSQECVVGMTSGSCHVL
jgi:hypothetical protein